MRGGDRTPHCLRTWRTRALEIVTAVTSTVESFGSTARGQEQTPHDVTQRTRTYVPDVRTSLSPASADALYDRAVATITRDRQASRAHLQRRLNIQPKWAASLLQRLEADGVIGAADAHGHHQVLVGAAA